MRDIKFRAWDGNRMLFNAKDGYNDFIIEGGELSIFGEFDLRERKTPDYPLMQFTGIHDCNGKEIYEGDIVRWSPATKDAGKHLIKQWEKIEPVIWSDKYTGWFTKSSHYGLGLYSYIEVIGNIYENPELLENNND